MQDVMFSKLENGNNSESDSIALVLSRIAQTILVVVFGLLPILFIPLVVAPYSYTKVLFVVAAVAAAVVFFALSILRSGELKVQLPLGLMAFWVLALVTAIASLFSGDISDSFIGENFSVQSAAFVILMAMVASSVTILRSSKLHIIRLYTLITASALILGVFHAVRLVGGPELLSVGIFNSTTASLIGSWNDVALFFGLAILLALAAVEQLPLTKWGRMILSAVTALALLMLAVVNFSAVWLVLGAVSLMVLVYSLIKHRFKESTLGVTKAEDSLTSIILSAVVFVISVFFIIGGSSLGGMINKATNISYVEVRPSFSATVDIASSVYADNLILGIGPNKFGDAWKLYKNPAINQTVFWDTDFIAGNGYITTSIVTSGLAGALAWIVFLSLLVWSGIRMLFVNTHSDRFWYFIGTSSFIASVYLWGMSVLYVPTVSILILAAVCTGVMYAAYSVLVPLRGFSLSMQQHKRVGFILVMMAVVVIVGSVSTLYFVGRHYSALYTFNQARASVVAGSDLTALEQDVASAFALSGNDRFAREVAGYQLARLNSLVGVTNPTEAQQRQFQEAAVNGINSAQLAINADPKEPSNMQMLGQIYSLLGVAGVEGSYDRAIESFNQAELMNPTSPIYPLLRAQAELRRGDLEAARREAELSLSRKQNLTQAIFFLSQLDIAEGDLARAIARTQSIITLEPANATRYYQLGLLHSANNDLASAVASFREAVRIDPNYANARYLLALGLAELGDTQDALVELEKVLELNPGNSEVAAIIDTLRSGGTLPSSPTLNTVNEPQTVSSEEGAVTASEDPNTPLISPVNTVPDSGENDTTSVESEDNGAEVVDTGTTEETQ